MNNRIEEDFKMHRIRAKFLLLYIGMVLVLAACGGRPPEPPQVSLTPASLVNTTDQELISARLEEYGDLLLEPPPQGSFELEVSYVIEDTSLGERPTVYLLSYELPDGGPWDVEIASFFAGQISIIGHNAKYAFHHWHMNTNVTVWQLSQEPGQYSVRLIIQNYNEPTNNAYKLLWIDAFYKHP